MSTLLIFAGGLVFGFGLALSRMTQPEVVLSFLQWDDFGLGLVMGAASLVAGLTFHLVRRFKQQAPLGGKSYELREKTFDKNVIIGGVIFGLGWGVSGICPGAAYASLGIGNWPILIAITGMFLGTYLLGWWQFKREQQAPNNKLNQ